METRIVFMGSPEFAVPSLAGLIEHFNIVGVVTQPDRPAGRGRTLRPPAVKEYLLDKSVPIIQPEKLREETAFEQLLEWHPELIVVAAYGQILRKNVLDLPKFGCINVHASLLPRWRGASPIQAAIAAGDTETGITIMKMDVGLDTGDILDQVSIPVQDDDTAETLEMKLAELGKNLLIEMLPGYISGKIKPIPQVDELSTYAPLLKKSDGNLDLNKLGAEICRKVRAYNPWPGTSFKLDGESYKIHKVHFLESESSLPYEKKVFDGYPAVGVQDGYLVIETIQPPGKKAMDGKVFLCGCRTWQEFCED